MNAESYVGITLWNPHGEAIGLIAVIGRNALVDTRITEMVLKQVAIRAAAELDNRNAEDVLSDSENRLRSVPVIIFSMYPEDQFAVRAIKSGASGTQG